MTAASNKSPPLRPYQQDVLEKMIAYDGRAALCVLATGLGKTRIFTEFLRCEAVENDHTCLILSHREELVTQPLEYLKDVPCGIEQGMRHADPARHKIIAASVQSLIHRLRSYNPLEVQTIIIDEAHHAAAPTYRKIVDYFPNAVIFGFTATAHRGDGAGLDCVFTDLICEYDVKWGVQNGYLAPIECVQTKLKYNMGSVKIRTDTGDYSGADIARIMSGTADGVVEAYHKYARGQTIIFAASVDEARDITDILNAASPNTAALIIGATKNRGRLLEGYRLGIYRVLVNFGVLTEGTDLPMTETVLIARPVAHTNVGLYAQMVGRGLRLCPGKASCLVIDCIGISDAPICTAATLIGKPPSDPEKADQSSEKPPDELPADQNPILTGAQIPTTWLQNERRVDIMMQPTGTDIHDVAWLALPSGGYVLAVPGMVYRISRPLADGKVYLRKNKKCSKAPMPQQFIFDYVYTDLVKKHKKFRHIWDKTQRKYWDKNPATAQQLALIARIAPGQIVDTSKLTRGDASQLIQFLLYAQNAANLSVAAPGEEVSQCLASPAN